MAHHVPTNLFYAIIELSVTRKREMARTDYISIFRNSSRITTGVSSGR